MAQGDSEGGLITYAPETIAWAGKFPDNVSEREIRLTEIAFPTRRKFMAQE